MGKYVLIIIWLIIVPFIIGYITTAACKISFLDKFAYLFFCYAMGHVIMWAMFQVLSVPLILLKQKLDILIVLWMFCICIVSLIMFLYSKKNDLFIRKFHVNNCSNVDKWFFVILAIIAIVIIGYQCYKYMFFMHLDEDDSRFIVTAVDAYETGDMYLINPATGEYVGSWVGELAKDVSSPWSMYLACISKLVCVYPTIFAHTVYPPFLLIIGYCAFYMIGSVYFKGNKKKSIGVVIIASVMHMYCAETAYTQSRFALVRIWQGKAAVAAVMIPLLFGVVLLLHEQSDNRRIFGLLLLNGLAMCLMSGMGIFFGGIIIVVYGVWYLYVTKKMKNLGFIVVSCLPTIIYGITYVFVK